jgi:hypothetical protein
VFSPGLVADKEILLREMLNPDHVVDDEIQPTAISLTDLRERGFSVHRMGYVTWELVEISINEKLARPFQGKPRASEGVARFTAREVREIQYNGNQAFVVVDTATELNPGHASIYLANIDVHPSLARGMRDKLRPLLNRQISLTEAFAGQ